MKNINIRTIAAATGGILYFPGQNTAAAGGTAGADYGNEASGVFIDSRLCGKDSVFVAIKGEHSDGHSYIKDVFAKGALCVICEHLPEDYPVRKQIGDFSAITNPDVQFACQDISDADKTGYGPCIVVGSSTEALKKLAAYYRNTLDIRIVGIVGSMGKTNTKEMVASVLSQHYNTHKTSGNFNNEIGVPLTLLAIREEHEIAVVEMGISDFGEMDRLGAIVRPDAVVMTNIGPCHLEFLHDLDGVLKAKSEVFKHIRKGGLIALNGSDEKLKAIGRVPGCRICYYNVKNPGSDPTKQRKKSSLKDRAVSADINNIALNCENDPGNLSVGISSGLSDCSKISAEDIKNLGLSGTTFRLVTPAGKIDAAVSLPGAHTVTNAQAAAAIGLEFGLSLNEIAAGIAAVKPVQGRGYIEKIGKFTIIDDCYNANPESVKAAIDLLKTAKGRKCAILGDMFELGDNSDLLHAQVGEYASKAKLTLAIFIGRLSKNGYDAYSAYSAINRRKRIPGPSASKTGAPAKPALPRAMYFKDLDTFFVFFRTIPLKKGDNILLKASHGMHFDKILAFFRENAIL